MSQFRKLMASNHVQNFDALLAEGLQEWRGRDGSNTLACDVEDVVLSFLHAVHVLLEADLLITRLGGVEAQELCNLGAVGGVFMHPQLQTLSKCLVELLVIILQGFKWPKAELLTQQQTVYST